MRFDLLLDALYLAGSISGVLPEVPVCSSIPTAVAKSVQETPLRTVRAVAEVTAFVDVHVVPMDAERVLRHQTVLVQDEKIVAVGPVAKIKVPAGAIRIDGRGKYLMPGLADMHVHGHPRNIYGKTEAELTIRLQPYITEGVTTLRYFYRPESTLAERFKNAEAAGGPRIYAPGFVVDAGHVLGRKRSELAEDIADAKAAEHRFTYMGTATVNSPNARLSAAVDSFLMTAHRLGLAVAAHDHGSSFGKTLALGRVGGSIEHLAWFRDTLIGFSWQQFGPIGEREAEAAIAKIPTLARAVARAGLWVTPTLHCIVDSYNPPPLQTKIVQQIVKGLQDAGVKLLLAADDGYSIHDELSALVNAGLTPYQAILTGTRNVAQYFGVLDSTGTVAVGKRADLVLLYGNPLEHIRYTREPAGVMLHGRWLDRPELDRRLFAHSDPENELSRSWLRLGLLSGHIMTARPHPPADTTQVAMAAWVMMRTESHLQFKSRMEHFEALTDTVIAAKAGGVGSAGLIPFLRRLAGELGAMRTMLPRDKHAAFDPVARLWLREQARQGYHLRVDGVTSEFGKDLR